MQSLVSVIVPVFNVEKYIVDTIRSILNQSFLDFELILVNDGSQDNSISIAEDILSSENVKFKILYQENKGLSSARNLGLKHALGEFVVFVDSDDILDPEFLNALISQAKTKEITASVVNFRFITQGEDKTSVKKINYTVFDNLFLQEQFLKRKVTLIIPCMLIRRSFLIKNSIYFDESIYFSEDQEFIWRLINHNIKISYSDAKLYFYLIRPNSIMTTINPNKVMSGYVGIKKLEFNSSFINGMFVLPRWTIGALKTVAKRSDYKTFIYLTKKLELEKHLDILFSFPDIRVRLVAFVCKISFFIFYLIFKRF
ncbi:glycosyltransferase family 2 protein [Leptospira kanakyensis]|uniref:Glycosyltransferase family 2 protein n=1 Tax=Leptospira kanakyensis TaxID=2484968 RepID=A0A6N4Q8B6_9LEPT|nr:glycosyltransferase family 2 protein [Leptospira kanakyensis]TGK51911.1 glycosyltransferase family 2 protein [Leptospira kanakyensis]TGK57181.1 glycosyltransferase family 2 protein [Leptospira kanakyensis]TGK71803.1 glycosyltransferase family 2 protein [Leptospira kanakyensis]